MKTASTPEDKTPRGIIITSGAPRHPRVPFWAYLWSSADDPDEDAHRRGSDRPPGPALASTG